MREREREREREPINMIMKSINKITFTASPTQEQRVNHSHLLVWHQQTHSVSIHEVSVSDLKAKCKLIGYKQTHKGSNKPQQKGYMFTCTVGVSVWSIYMIGFHTVYVA